ncbi:MAG TPA: hypothetical protein VF549_08305 [Solirubrobacteraceae bacterium]|jgi:hypothetical protein
MTRVLTVLAAVALAGLVQAATAQADPPAGTIVYVKRSFISYNLFLVSADGTQNRQLTNADGEHLGGGLYRSPRWSPDGSRIAYTYTPLSPPNPIPTPEKPSAVWTMRADGSDRTLVAEDASGLGWLPDGRIVFGRRSTSGVLTRWVADADGGNAQLYKPGQPVSLISPDGSKIAYVDTNVSWQGGVVVANADGSDARNLADWNLPPNVAQANTPVAFSPDSKRLMFSTSLGANEIGYRGPHAYTMNLDGSDIRLVSVEPLGGATWINEEWAFATSGGPRFVNVQDGSVTSLGVGDLEADWTHAVHMLDAEPPVVQCASPDDQWHSGDVELACTASDHGAGLAEGADSEFVLSTAVPPGEEHGDAATATRHICDRLGNCADAGPIRGLRVDRKPPGVDCGASPEFSWQRENVSIGCSASDDAGSGLADGSDSQFMLSTSVGAGEDDAAASTGTRAVCDAVGNCTTAGPLGVFRIDRRQPMVECDSPDDDWHAKNVSLRCSSTDGGSALADSEGAEFVLSTAVAAGQEDADAETGSRKVCDQVGNCVTVGPVGGVRVDRQQPRVSCEALDSAWHGENVTVACSASDGGSGLADAGEASFGLSTSVAAGQEDADAETGSRKVCDQVGNCVTVGPVGGVHVDRKNPTLEFSGNSSAYAADELVSITCRATDSGAGIRSDTCQDINSPAYSFGAGEHTLSATAVDEVGNTSQSSTRFVVNVTTTSLSSLTTSFVDAAPAGNGLLAKIDRIDAAKSPAAKAAAINAFINQVRSQDGKSLTHAEAAALIELAQSLA